MQQTMSIKEKVTVHALRKQQQEKHLPAGIKNGSGSIDAHQTGVLTYCSVFCRYRLWSVHYRSSSIVAESVEAVSSAAFFASSAASCAASFTVSTASAASSATTYAASLAASVACSAASAACLDTSSAASATSCAASFAVSFVSSFFSPKVT